MPQLHLVPPAPVSHPNQTHRFSKLDVGTIVNLYWVLFLGCLETPQEKSLSCHPGEMLGSTSQGVPVQVNASQDHVLCDFGVCDAKHGMCGCVCSSVELHPRKS